MKDLAGPKPCCSGVRGAWLSCLAASLLLVALLAGCGPEPVAPSPTINPHAHKYSHLKITVQPGSGVNRVKVFTTWVIGNLGCAPHQRWSGATIQKQVDTEEKVEKVDGYYLATISDDRFLPGKCKWVGGEFNSEVQRV